MFEFTVNVKRGPTTDSNLPGSMKTALDKGTYALMASIDLTAAFNMVNIDLLLFCLRIMDLLVDVVDLIEVWIRDRSFYIQIGYLNSILHNIHSGSMQGSILAPFLRVIYVSPLFDLKELFNFAIDNFGLSFSSNKQLAIADMKIKLKFFNK